MFKLRKPKQITFLIRAEELQIGDVFVYDGPVSVLSVTQDGDDMMSVLLDTSNDGEPAQSQLVSLYNELLITVVRR